ncbi:MAG: hypothetical protein CME00_03790 [Geminicoccus sp.]|nr:hypothetical protein [Geminicoccus sp.]HCH99312.1 hypothetical protein [Alphaproteobacteria bacterium]
MVRSIYAKGAAKHLNPVPNAAVHRGVLVTSGVLGKDPATGDYAPETAEQIRLAFEQLPAILAEGGAELQDVVKVDLYFADRQDRAMANVHWERLWPDPMQRPARQAHQVDLPGACRFQLVAMAVLG